MKRRVHLALACTLTTALVGCSSDDVAKPNTLVNESTDAPVELRLNEVQLIGTHNSYHVAPEAKLFAAEKAIAAELGDDAGGLGDINSLSYTHPPLTEQLDLGIRSFELDVYADPEGGLFSNPLAPGFLQITDTPLPTGIDEPGFKVIHINDVDFISTCPTLISCLTEIDTWSTAHPDHLPIVINLELKDEKLPAPIDITEVVEIGPDELAALDAEIRSVFAEDQLLTPDDVRGANKTLDEAVTTDGWPLLDDTRGQVMFFMDNAGRIRDHYIATGASLEGRTMFTSSAAAGDPDRAVIKINEPGDGSEIKTLVEAGYFIRTRADADLAVDGPEALKRRDIAFSSGAQVVSTDFPINTANFSASGNPTSYSATMGSGVQAQCIVLIVQACPTSPLEPQRR